MSNAEQTHIWGGQLRIFREEANATQRALADMMRQICDALDDAESPFARYTVLKLDCAEGIASYDIARFEGDPRRIPAKRGKHRLLISALLELGAPLTVARINAWLALGDQGWLTDDELQIFLPCGLNS